MSVDFGKLLSGNRKKVGFTQEKLANKISWKRGYMSRVESGHINPTFPNIEKLCVGLGMTLSEFFGGIENETRDPAIIIHKSSDKKIASDEYRIKSEMVPIKVVKNLDAFSSSIDIKKEFASKYILIEKNMFEHPEDIVGYDAGFEFKSRLFSVKSPTILIDVVDTNFERGPYHLFESRNKEGDLLPIKIVEIINTGPSGPPFLICDPYESEDPGPGAYPVIYETFSEEALERDMIRGTVVGIIGRLPLSE